METCLLQGIDANKICNPALKKLILDLQAGARTPETAQTRGKRHYTEHSDYNDYSDMGDNYGRHSHHDYTDHTIKDLPRYDDHHHGDYCD